MQTHVLDIMQNDSLVRQLLRDYNYNRGLVEEKYLQMDVQQDEISGDSIDDSIGRFFDSVVRFLHDIPAVVWILLGVFLLSLVLYVLFKNGVFSFYRKYSTEPLKAEDDIYEIDYDNEMESAVREDDYPAIVRLVYLSTLRQLDERGTIVWRLYKTPSQFATEVKDEAFNKMTRHFLRVRYGKFPASKQMCDEMRRLSEQVLKGGGR